jgi:hypothetical protein
VDNPPWLVLRRQGDETESFFQRAGEVVTPETVFHYTRIVS